MKSLSFFSLVTLICLFIATPLFAQDDIGDAIGLLGDEPNYLNLAFGVFDAFNNNEDAFAGQIELRCGKKLFHIGPLAGIHANVDGSVIGYAGLYFNFAVGPVIISPQTGVGLYEKGDGKDLGGTLEFISGLDISYQLPGGARLGVRGEHISNAELHENNPGADSFLLSYGIPF